VSFKQKGTQTVTRIAILGTNKLNKWKSEELDLIALGLGKLRSDLWNEFGSLKAWGISKFEIDKQLRPFKDKYELPAKLWDSTLYDVIDDIHLVQSACIEKVMKALGQKYQSFQKNKRILQLTLESQDWMQHPKLCTLVRKFWYRGHTKVSNQIILRAFDTAVDERGAVWLRFGGLEKGKTLKLPTTLPHEVKCQLRLIKRALRWEIHYTTNIEKASKKNEGLVIGCDRGYTEVYATSNNDGARFIGENFGQIQTAETDYRTAKQVKRNKIRAIVKLALAKGDSAKADRIERNNRLSWVYGGNVAIAEFSPSLNFNIW